MILADLVAYSQNDVERLVRDYMAGRPDFPTSPPVKIDYILETTPNVILDTMEGLVAKHRVEGAVCSRLMSRDIIVFVDQDIADSSDEARYNAAIGEELAHIHIHQGILIHIDSVEAFLEVQSDPYRSRFELDARNYSAALRMPCDMIDFVAQKLYPEIVDDLGFGQARQIQMTLSARMAKLFAVPIDDMHRRLLTWPCEIYRRVERSVLDCSPYLLGEGAIAKIKPYRQFQREFPSF